MCSGVIVIVDESATTVEAGEAVCQACQQSLKTGFGDEALAFRRKQIRSLQFCVTLCATIQDSWDVMIAEQAQIPRHNYDIFRSYAVNLAMTYTQDILNQNIIPPVLQLCTSSFAQDMKSSRYVISLHVFTGYS